MRGCGLKLADLKDKAVEQLVAPHAGVWIETMDEYTEQRVKNVAPHAGVWIETLNAGT